MVFIEGCKNPRSVTILIRGGTERIVDEAERSIHDALCVVRDVVQEPKILAGGVTAWQGAARSAKLRRSNRDSSNDACRERGIRPNRYNFGA